MKLSKLIDELNFYKTRFYNDPDVTIRTPNFNDSDIQGFCMTASNTREDIYLVLLSFDEESIPIHTEVDDYFALPWYKRKFLDIKYWIYDKLGIEYEI